MSLSTADILRDLEGLTDQAQREYLEAVRWTVSAATYVEVQRLLQADRSDDLTGYLALTGLGAFIEVLRRAYRAGAAGEQAPRPLDVMTAPDMADLVRLIQDDQAAAVRAVVQAGQSQGRSPGQIARDLLGVAGAAPGRQGGTVGQAHVDAVARLHAREELTSDEARRLRDYLRRQLRDPALDPIIRRALQEGRPLRPAEAEQVERSYADRLTAHRARVVSESAAHEQYERGRFDSYDRYTNDPNWLLEKEWRTVGDERVRHSHRPMNRQRQQFDAPFISGRGALLNFPGDRSLGAGFDEVAGCRCHANYRLRRSAS